MKLIELYKLGKEQNNKLNELHIDNKIEKRIDRYSMLFHLITFLPFFIIFINLFKFISSERPLFFILTILAGICVALILVFNACLNIVLYKEFTKEEDESIINFFKSFNMKAFIINSLINVLILITICLIIIDIIVVIKFN